MALNSLTAVKSLMARVQNAAPEIEEKLAEYGAEDARLRFAAARYAGTNDVTVSVGESEGHAAVVAQGDAVAFIEFGAGVRHGKGYPGERPKDIVDIGKYGQGKGASGRPWVYRGEQGSAGWQVRKKNGDPIEGLSMTYGNPPNAPMYHAANRMREEAGAVAKEVLAR